MAHAQQAHASPGKQNVVGVWGFKCAVMGGLPELFQSFTVGKMRKMLAKKKYTAHLIRLCLFLGWHAGGASKLRHVEQKIDIAVCRCGCARGKRTLSGTLGLDVLLRGSVAQGRVLLNF